MLKSPHDSKTSVFKFRFRPDNSEFKSKKKTNQARIVSSSIPSETLMRARIFLCSCVSLSKNKVDHRSIFT